MDKSQLFGDIAKTFNASGGVAQMEVTDKTDVQTSNPNKDGLGRMGQNRNNKNKTDFAKDNKAYSIPYVSRVLKGSPLSEDLETGAPSDYEMLKRNEGYWSNKYSTVKDIISYTGFDGYYREVKDLNSNYSQAMRYLDNPENFEDYVKIPEFINNLINLCLPVYYGEVPDITNGAVYYYSPKTQATKHEENPELYKKIRIF